MKTCRIMSISKDFNRFMCNKTKNKIKISFKDVFYNVLVMKKSCKYTNKFVWR